MLSISSITISSANWDQTQLNQVVLTALTNNTAYKKGIRYSISKGLGSPYWLLEKGSLGVFKIKDKNLIGQPETPALKLPIEVSINGSMIVFEEKINYRINDPVRGEVITPFYTLPQLGINFEKEVNLYPNDTSKKHYEKNSFYRYRWECHAQFGVSLKGKRISN